MEFVKKLWGYEKILVNTELYCFKELTLLPNGQASSVHYHKSKTETFIVREGEVALEIYNKFADSKPTLWFFKTLRVGDIFTVDPLFPHRFWCLGDLVARFDEVSTHSEDSDSYRLIPAGTYDRIF